MGDAPSRVDGISNAYAAPRDDGLPPAAGAPRAKKPLRMWLLQGHAVLQVLLFSGAMVWGIATGNPAALPLYRIAIAIGYFAIQIVPAAVLALSLQRLTPKPRWVAPIAGLVWWSAETIEGGLSWGEPPPAALEGYYHQGVEEEQLVFALLFRAFWLWLVVAMFFDRRVRAYLDGAAPVPRFKKAANS